MRRLSVICAVQGILACCLVFVPATSGVAVAQVTSQSSFAGPVQPDGWQIEDWRQHRLRYGTALRVVRLSSQDKENLTRGVEFYLYGMTMLEPPEPIIELRRSLLTNLRSTLTSPAARQFLLEEVVRISGELLDQPPHVRLNVMILLASLATNPTPAPPLPFVPANDIMLSVIHDPDQLVQCKIWAARGLTRISRDGNPNVTIKSNIAVELVNALDSPEAQTDPQSEDSADWWYRLRLLDALGDNATSVNIQQEPIVIDAVTKILVDPREHWLIRSTAARVCTELNWGGLTNVPLINHIVCVLTHEMAEEYNQHLIQNNNVEGPYWRRCFINAYLSYQPLTVAQRQRGWGLLNQAEAEDRALVLAGYGVVLPVINAVTRNNDPEAIPQAVIDALGDWLGNDEQDNWQVTPSSDELNRPRSPEEPEEVTPAASSLNPEGPAAQNAETIAGASGR